MKFILGNHWEAAPKGWTTLKEADQDMTARLKWDDNTVDALFTEHVTEHLNLTSGILYFREAHRVLKPSGIIRTVCPMVDQMVKFGNDWRHKNYAENQLRHYYPEEDAALQELGIDFNDYGLEFMLDSLLKKHGHQHVWSSQLMEKVLRKIGFTDVATVFPGTSYLDPSTCLERRLRGVDETMFEEHNIFDPESLVVEARK